YRLSRDSVGRPVSASGFVTDAAQLGALLQGPAERVPLLPASLTRGLAMDSLIQLVVHTASGRILYRKGPATASYYSAARAVGSSFGGLTADLSLRPDIAGRLIIGGLPRSRLPIVLSLLAVTTVLVFTAVIQLRREHELARLRADFVSSVSHELRTP